MNKSDLIKTVSENTGLPMTQVKHILETSHEVIASALGRGDDVQIYGFGLFSVQHRDQRQARNPRTGEPVTVAAKKAVKFKPSRELSESVSKR